jgi:uncharacterized protein
MNALTSFDPVFLFFFLGMLAAWIRSDLEISPAVSKFLSVFLLLSLGLKGGHEVAMTSDPRGFYLVCLIGLSSCIAIPLYLFPMLRRKIGDSNAAALAACYGSVSAVTYVAAQEFLRSQGIAFSGFMVALMALMEIPAIMIALYLRRLSLPTEQTSKDSPSLFAAKSVVLLLGGFFIGFVMNESSWKGIAPVVQGNFKGVLIFFLVDLGLAAQPRLKEAWKHRGTAILCGCLLPLAHGMTALLVASAFGVSQGNQILLAVLAGSASYIAAPAAIRASVPEANPSLYVALPLALTFPLNIMLGIPLYAQVSHWLLN